MCGGGYGGRGGVVDVRVVEELDVTLWVGFGRRGVYLQWSGGVCAGGDWDAGDGRCRCRGEGVGCGTGGWV
jgi:hypothetical protein